MQMMTEEEFQATMGDPQVAIQAGEGPPFDFWAYFDEIPASHFSGYDFTDGQVDYVWTTRDGEYQHVLVRCERPNVFLVIVLDLRSRVVKGHHLLNLKELYGME